MSMEFWFGTAVGCIATLVLCATICALLAWLGIRQDKSLVSRAQAGDLDAVAELWAREVEW
jgi:hypothetical protein